MAVFNYQAYPNPGQACLTCGTQENARGFVDFVSDVNVVREDFTIAGEVDVLLCANCAEQAAKVVGSATKQEVEDLVYEMHAKDQELVKAKDEAAAWQQRIFQLASLDLDDFKRLSQLEKEDQITYTPPTP